MDNEYRVLNSGDIASPALIFYRDKIETNIRKALAIAKDPGRLRPHVKTHKTSEIVKMQMAAGIGKFKCATIAEAEMLGMAGAPDVLLAYPLVGPQIGRFIRLAAAYPGTNFKALVDNRFSAEKLSAAASAAGMKARTFIDVDPGLHRTGVDPGEPAVDLYRYVAKLPGLLPAGIHCYDGQIHQADENARRAEADKCYRDVADLRNKLASLRLPVETVVMGGTPTFPIYAAYPEVELSPGTCFLNDYSYSSSYADMNFERAAVVLARVISLHPAESTFTLDLGTKAIAADPAGKRGIILGMEDAEPLFQNEEHWVFRGAKNGLPGLGDELYVLPTHICPTCALHAEACVVDSDRTWSSSWEIIARNRRLKI